jgi:hypothetical protein
MIVDDGKYYLYSHVRLDTLQPFYIGIGTKSGSYAQYNTEYRRAFSFKKRNKYWNRIANKTKFEVSILLQSNDFKFIKEKEIEFINIYGRINTSGLLSNMTDGGDGTHGLKKTQEQIFKSAIDSTGIKNRRSKKCFQYSINGDLVNTFDSFNLAAKFLGCKKQNLLVAKDKFGISNGYHWMDKEISKIDFLKKKTAIPSRVYKHGKIVEMIDIETNQIVKSFKKVKEAQHFFNKKSSNIKMCLCGRYKTAYGYKWRYKK